MRWPFSYKDDIFLPLLIVSFSAHVAVLGVSRFVPSRASFSVMKAPNSLAVQIIKEISISQIKEEVKEAVKIEPAVSDEEPASLPQRASEEKQEHELFSAGSQGAITEAQPASIHNPAPIYPRVARQRGWEGLVKLRVHVTQEGTAREVLIAESSGYTVLDESAAETVKHWQFVAAQSGQQTFDSWITIPVRFQLVSE